jgi:hypothetical protein
VEAARRRAGARRQRPRRVEDNLYLPNGEMARSNGELIAKARQMAEDVGRRAATSPRRASCWGPKRERSAA